MGYLSKIIPSFCIIILSFLLIMPVSRFITCDILTMSLLLEHLSN